MITGLATSCVGTVFYTALLQERCKEGRIEVTRRRKKGVSSYWMILKKSKYWKLKEEALDGTLWGTSYKRVYGPIVKQTAERKKERTKE
jgi:hypothetical protein